MSGWATGSGGLPLAPCVPAPCTQPIRRVLHCILAAQHPNPVAPSSWQLRRGSGLVTRRKLFPCPGCHGSWAALEALAHDKRPFYAIVGPREKMSLSDLAIRFSSYYHVLSKTWKLADAHAAMRAAAHNDAFMLFETEVLKDGFAKWSLEQRINHALNEKADKGVPEAPDAPPAEPENHAP